MGFSIGLVRSHRCESETVPMPKASSTSARKANASTAGAISGGLPCNEVLISIVYNQLSPAAASLPPEVIGC